MARENLEFLICPSVILPVLPNKFLWSFPLHKCKLPLAKVRWYVAAPTWVFANLLCDTQVTRKTSVFKSRNVPGGSFPILTPMSRPVIKLGFCFQALPQVPFRGRESLEGRSGAEEREVTSRDWKLTAWPDRTCPGLAQRLAFPPPPPSSPCCSRRPRRPRRPCRPRSPAPLASAPELRPGRPGTLQAEEGVTLT